MLIVRPAIASDLAAIVHLAELAGPGFTSLAVGAGALEARLNKSLKSFSGGETRSPDHIYLLILEDTETNEVLGMSAVKSEIGIRDPFFNFRILNVAQKSAVTGSRFDMQVLVLVNEYGGATEVGSLFVKDGYRGTGAGRLISQSRYMLMAASPSRFGDKVVSELRGHVTDKGESPFWDSLGRKFFRMDFQAADKISAEKDNQFILDLMPSHPIYVELLSEEAQAVIGQTHPDGVGARRFLEKEGFRYDGVIDIFDAGPSMSAPLEELRTIRDSRLLEVAEAEPSNDDALQAMISNDDVENFRCVMVQMSFSDNIANISARTLKLLNLSSGDRARIWIKR